MSDEAKDVVARLRAMRTLYVESGTWKPNSRNAVTLNEAIALIEAQALELDRRAP